VQPSEEELFLRYNPELQKRSLENRIGKQEDFDAFVGKLKEYSKSDKPSTFLDSFWRLEEEGCRWMGCMLCWERCGSRTKIVAELDE